MRWIEGKGGSWMKGGGGATTPTGAKGLALGSPVGAGWFCRQNARRAEPQGETLPLRVSKVQRK
jgi:hypothetical protein